MRTLQLNLVTRVLQVDLTVFQVFRRVHCRLPLHQSANDPSVLQIRDVYPGSGFLSIPVPESLCRIPDPTTATKEGGKICCFTITFFVATKINRVENYFIFEQVQKEI
jgi:hypothetical protein